MGERLRRGHDFSEAIALDDIDPGRMSAQDPAALERDELFNTRVSDYIAWAQVFRTLIPDAARRGPSRRRDARSSPPMPPAPISKATSRPAPCSLGESQFRRA